MNYIHSFLQDVSFEKMPENVKEQAKRCFLDLIGTAVAGSQTQLSEIIHQHVYNHYSPLKSNGYSLPLLGGESVSPLGAALIGGMMIDAMDSHDGHSLTKGHVGCAVLPALIAVLEATGNDVSWEEFLTYLVAGYEIGTRAGIALHSTACDYHTSGAWNAVNCAALAAKILGADEMQLRHAIGIAEYHGPRSQMMRGVDHPTMLKDGSGWGAMAGISAAYLAMDGFTGAPALTVESPDVKGLWESLGQNWLILEQYFKPYPCCRWAHPALDATKSLIEKHQISVDEIDSLIVHTFHEATRLNQSMPETTEQAQYATAFPIAAMLVYGKLSANEIDGESINNREVKRLCERVTLIEEESYSLRFPAERWAHVTITLKDGTSFISDAHTAVGDPANPITDEALVNKYLDLVVPVWGVEKSNRLLSLVDEMANGEKLSYFLAELRSG